MNILLIGGTRFVGRHIVDRALANGHTVTIFTRGQTNPALFPEVEKLTGDRDGNLDALAGRTWDCAIDTCGYFPRIVAQSVNLLKSAVKRYVFISTVSVYDETGKDFLPEDSDLRTIADETIEELTQESYGALKVLCERIAHNAFGKRALIIRPGLIVGPHDNSDRFTYWPRRMSQGGRVLVPDLPDQPTQYIDVRDLAAFTIALAETKQSGIYNAVGPMKEILLIDFLNACRHICRSDAEFVFVPDEFLQKQDNLTPFMDIPMWVSGAERPFGSMRADNNKALKAGMIYRSLDDTIADTLAWDATRPEEEKYRCGLKPEREAELLAAWDKEQETSG